MSPHVLWLMLAILIIMNLANWLSVVVYYRARQGFNGNKALQVAFVRAIARAIGFTVSTVFWYDVTQGFQWFGQDGFELAMFLVLACVSLPSVWFLWLVATGGFRDDSTPL